MLSKIEVFHIHSQNFNYLCHGSPPRRDISRDHDREDQFRIICIKSQKSFYIPFQSLNTRLRFELRMKCTRNKNNCFKPVFFSGELKKKCLLCSS